ncbi:cytochrome C oxidase Cbb3, partial [Helicobacter pylori]
FIDTVKVLIPYYNIRGVGGLMYFIGFIIFAYNIFMTITAGKKLEREPNYATPMSR